MTCRRLFWAVMTFPKWTVSPVKYLAYGNNSVVTDSDETYILLMKKPCFDKIIGSGVSRQGRKYGVSNAYKEARLLPKLIDWVLQASLGLKIKSSPSSQQEHVLGQLVPSQNTLSYNNIPASHLLDAEICLFPLVSKSLSVSPFETPRAAGAGILILLRYLSNIFFLFFFFKHCLHRAAFLPDPLWFVFCFSGIS